MKAAPIALLSSLALVPALMPASAAAQDSAVGERLFRTRCGSCHSIEPGQNRIGPSLSGIFGRKAGSVEGARYSAGMRELGVTWDTAQLETFLTNPRAMVKGTTMTIAVTRAEDRQAIAAYLQGTATSSN
jgi:cytochrome c